MSLELVIIPFALAAISAAAAAKSTKGDSDSKSVVVGTRMRNERLLCQPLVQLGAVVSTEEGSITAKWAQVQARFSRDSQGIWSAHFSDGCDYERAVSMLTDIDAIYAALVQQEVLTRLRERAPSMGFSVESEKVAEDLSVTMVLNVQAGGA